MATLSEERRPTSPALDDHIDRRWREAVARAQRERRDLFDGPILRWLRHELLPAQAGASGAAAGPRLAIAVGRGSFREFVGTNLDASFQPDVASDPAVGAVPWSHFGNAIGTSAIVLTRDGQLLVGRRSARVFAYSGYVHSFGGLLEAGGGNAIDVGASMRRELTEELALAPAELRDLTLNGAIVDPRIHQPELLYEVRVPLTTHELHERWRTAASRDEHVELVALPDDERAIEAAVERVAPISPIGRACVALHFRS